MNALHVHPSRVCEFKGCDNQTIAVLMAHPIRRDQVGGCTSVCADHIEHAAQIAARAFLISNHLVQPADDRERDYLARIEEHVV
jgi:hypothetical protein